MIQFILDPGSRFTICQSPSQIVALGRDDVLRGRLCAGMTTKQNYQLLIEETYGTQH
jgi:hypothetical protein